MSRPGAPALRTTFKASPFQSPVPGGIEAALPAQSPLPSPAGSRSMPRVDAGTVSVQTGRAMERKPATMISRNRSQTTLEPGPQRQVRISGSAPLAALQASVPAVPGPAAQADGAYHSGRSSVADEVTVKTKHPVQFLPGAKLDANRPVKQDLNPLFTDAFDGLKLPRELEPIARRQAPATTARPAPTAPTEPSVNIGTVEVRILPAPAVALSPTRMHAPRPAEGPALSRGYAAGFGLSQS